MRDRFRTEVVLDSRSMARHLDYNIDYLQGTLFFKQPGRSRDMSLNPVCIVVDDESLCRSRRMENAKKPQKVLGECTDAIQCGHVQCGGFDT